MLLAKLTSRWSQARGGRHADPTLADGAAAVLPGSSLSCHVGPAWSLVGPVAGAVHEDRWRQFGCHSTPVRRAITELPRVHGVSWPLFRPPTPTSLTSVLPLCITEKLRRSLCAPPVVVRGQQRTFGAALPGGGGACRGCSPLGQAVAQGRRSTGPRAGRPPGHQVPKALTYSWARPVGTARRRVVSVAEG
jgi:hypothetical protein